MKLRTASYLKRNNKLYRVRRRNFGEDADYVFQLSRAGLCTVRILCSLQDSTILINGVETDTLVLESNTSYTWSVSRPGFNTVSGSGTLTKNVNIPVEYVLVNAPVNTSTIITGNVGGEQVTGTSGIFFQGPETISYACTVTSAGHAPYSKVGTTNTDTIINIGEFSITTDVVDTTIEINGAQANSVFFDRSTPFTYTYSMSKPGFTTFTATGTVLDSANINISGFSVTCTENDATIRINSQTTSGVFFVTNTTFNYDYSITLLGSPAYTQYGSINTTTNINVVYKALEVTATDAVVTLSSLGSTFTGVGSATTKLPVGIGYVWTVSRTGYTGATGSGTLLTDLTVPVYAVTGQNATFDLDGSGSEAMYVEGGTTITYTASNTDMISYTAQRTISADTVLTMGTLTASITPTPDSVTINGTAGTVALLEEGIPFAYTIAATKSGYNNFSTSGTVSTTTVITGTMQVNWPSYSRTGLDGQSNNNTLYSTTISAETAGNYAITIKGAGSDSTNSITPTGQNTKYSGNGRGGIATFTVYLAAGASIKFQWIGANQPAKTVSGTTYRGTRGHTGIAFYIDNVIKVVAGGGGSGSVVKGALNSSGVQNWYGFNGGGGGYGGGAGTDGGNGLNYNGSAGSSSTQSSGTPYGGHAGYASTQNTYNTDAKGGNGYVASDFNAGSTGTHYRVISISCTGGTNWGASSKKGNSSGASVSFAHTN